jgi:hypothetical protein
MAQPNKAVRRPIANQSRQFGIAANPPAQRKKAGRIAFADYRDKAISQI